ncbi:WD repeat domain-containing protein 83 [Hyalella azteca]|uniref:WD repeat domain-containing protein 83 n=1 Tax=Hyalella azteca TaxID=294128 RepID=A0A979FRH0_HYAAZ|nr:WD repeat domain-containing protein 83 [Hyalella azteca]
MGESHPDTTTLPSKLERVLECKQGAVRAVRFNVDGGYCLTCGSDKSVKLWNPHTGALLCTFAGHGYEVLDARGSADNSLVVSGGLDKSVMVWDMRLTWAGWCWDLRARRRDPIQVLDEAKDSVMSVSVAGHELLSASLDCNTRVYDLRNGRLTANCLGQGIECCFNDRDTHVFSGSEDGHVYCWDLITSNISYK